MFVTFLVKLFFCICLSFMSIHLLKVSCMFRDGHVPTFIFYIQIKKKIDEKEHFLYCFRVSKKAIQIIP